MELADKIKNLRVSLGMSQKEFGKELGLSQEAIAGYEVRGREPSLDILKNMLKLAKQHNIKFKVFEW